MNETNPLQAPRLAEIAAGRKFWGYLDTEALRLRYVLAAHFLRSAQHVVEIGGYRENLITNFLTSPPQSVSVFSLDVEFRPHAAESLLGSQCRVRHVRGYFQEALRGGQIPPAGIGVVALGIELQGDPEPFLELLQRSEIAVVEFARDHAPSVAWYEWAVAKSGLRTRCVVDLDFSPSEPLMREALADSMNPPFWRRRLATLAPA